MKINRPVRPTLLWDGECTFCAHWIRRWKKVVGDVVDYRTYQEARSNFPLVSEADCAQAVQLILPDGHVFSAAHAVLYSLALSGRAKRLLRCYDRSALCRRLTESAYRFVAANRSWLPRL